jgi:hypothetical protein
MKEGRNEAVFVKSIGTATKAGFCWTIAGRQRPVLRRKRQRIEVFRRMVNKLIQEIR